MSNAGRYSHLTTISLDQLSTHLSIFRTEKPVPSLLGKQFPFINSIHLSAICSCIRVSAEELAGPNFESRMQVRLNLLESNANNVTRMAPVFLHRGLEQQHILGKLLTKWIVHLECVLT